MNPAAPPEICPHSRPVKGKLTCFCLPRIFSVQSLWNFAHWDLPRTPLDILYTVLESPWGHHHHHQKGQVGRPPQVVCQPVGSERMDMWSPQPP